jgi:L-ascorbate metabolism protein UlaG (beta-lactamase superfamily)
LIEEGSNFRRRDYWKFTMDASEAVETALALKPKVVIPMHHLKADPQAFKRRVEAKSGIRVVPLGIGEVLTLK